MASHTADINRVTRIISDTAKKPTIVNQNSKFVVVTYWWGRGNYNNNTARPCVAFYEQFIQQAIKFAINTALTIYQKKKYDIVFTQEFIEKLPPIIYNLPPYKDFLRRRSAAYLQMIFEHCKIQANPFTNSDTALREAYIAATKCLTKKQMEGTCPPDFTLKSHQELQKFFHRVIKEIIYQARNEISKLVRLAVEVEQLKAEYVVAKNQESIAIIKQQIQGKNIQKKELRNRIIDELKRKRISKQLPTNLEENTKHRVRYFEGFEERVNIFDILNDQLRYLNPLKFEEMIAKWEAECSKYGCNYLSVEYPEFAERGGYQLAINAKPIFIKKALELCGKRAIVYIDGDMYIRKYPILFDINDVDFMARGWWIDPRSSYKMEESIMYDPYTFETSGGIMYFSQSNHAQYLVNKWIEIAARPSQAGKADDRVISLVFNSYKMLLNMKIIQLPIEYLWLSLDYDERMRENVYNYETTKMKETIFVEHPECLTTEETAAGAGASSDRTPKFYDFLGEYLVPVSEVVHEYLMFPNKEMVTAFKDYYTYMDGITYIDDGNEQLYKKGFVNPREPGENESPLYIVAYDKKLGEKKSPENTSLSFNQVSEINFKRARAIKLDRILIIKNIADNIVEIIPDPTIYKISDAEMISLILRLLLDGKNVLYNPVFSSGYDPRYHSKLIKNLNTLYKDTEIGFVPIITSTELADFFKPGIYLVQPILFRPGNRIMIEFLSMFLSLEAFSSVLQYGSYEFMSRVRVAYIKKDVTKQEPRLLTNEINASLIAANTAGLQVSSGITSLGQRGGNQNTITDLLNEHEYLLVDLAGKNRYIMKNLSKNTRKNNAKRSTRKI